MSFRIVSPDDSSEKLLYRKIAQADEDEDESLTSVLGITKKDVVNLDDDATARAESEQTERLCEEDECQTDDDEEAKLVKTNDDDDDDDDDDEGKLLTTNDDKEELTENEESAVDEIDPESDGDTEGDNTVAEIHDDTDVEDDSDTDKAKDERKESHMDFKKLFGWGLDSSIGNGDPTPSTSKDIADDNETDSQNQMLITPSVPSVPKTTDSVHPGSTHLDKRKYDRTLLKNRITQRGKLVCGIVVLIMLICITMGLLAMGWCFGIEDLYIIGGIFGAGTVIFFVVFIFIRCTSNASIEYLTMYTPDSPEKKV